MYDVVIIGAGPAGYVAALRAGALGMKTALVERTRVGGRGLHAGVLPSKGMLQAARFYERVKRASQFGVEGVDPEKLRMSLRTARERTAGAAARMAGRIEAKLAERGVTTVNGEARLAGPNAVSVENRLLETRTVILATGSDTRALPFDMPRERTATAWTALSRNEIPAHVVVLGADPVAVEYAELFSMLGAEVTIATEKPRLLPMLGHRLHEAVTGRLERAGVGIVTEAGSYSYGNGRLKLADRTAPCDLLVNCIAERAVLPEMEIDLAMTAGFVQVDRYLRTSTETVYAVGNVNGLMPTARSASAQGLQAVNHIAGVEEPWNPVDEPIVVYGEPEIAQIGRTETTLEEQGVSFRVLEAPLSDNGKALLGGNEDGFVRILYERTYGEVLGVQIFAEEASDLIGEAGALMQFEGTVYDVARTAHAHPTISEVFTELGRTAGEQSEAEEQAE
ncbi:MAG: dihydrolipoyl dehydrogenase family protein [Spirochaetaceae bacterium]